jgi:hypothetical protein
MNKPVDLSTPDRILESVSHWLTSPRPSPLLRSVDDRFELPTRGA